MENLELKLTELSGDVKTFTEKAKEEIKSIGSVATETKDALETMRVKMHEMQTQLDAIDAKSQDRRAAFESPKTLGDMVVETEEYKSATKSGEFRLSGHGPLTLSLDSSAFLERKTDITNTGLGVQTTGTIQLVRLPGIVPIAQQSLRIRDLMNVVPQSTGNSFDFVYQATRLSSPSPQVEGSAKAQSYFNWAATSGSIRTIAHYVNVSKQALADVPWLRGQIDSELTYGLKVKEEAEILSGDGTGVHLNGIITQATAFDTSYLVAAAGWQRLDVLRYAKLQARLAGLATFAPNGIVLNPADMAYIELTKDSYGRYIIGDPKQPVVAGNSPAFSTVWGLPVVESDSMTSGSFLVGAFNTAADLIDRQAVSIEISYEHSTNFTSNLATVLCEERIGLAVKKATAFITGSFSTSPASLA